MKAPWERSLVRLRSVGAVGLLASLLFTSPVHGTFGACCDDATNTCTRELSEVCEASGLRYGGVDSICDEMDPPCGCTPLDCDDGVDCTIDDCDPEGDVCTHTPDDLSCDNGLYCDGVEFCDASQGCQAGQLPDCGFLDTACSVGVCNVDLDACSTEPINEGQTCDDGEFCTVDESCQDGACVGNEPPHCSAGDPTCDDCNFNTIPDVCDLKNGDSLDVDPVDGLPDECSLPEGDEGSNWTDNIWNLDNRNPDQPYPDNENGVPGQHVTIDGIDVFLNETVAIESLRLINDATLRVTQSHTGDLTINPNGTGGIRAEGTLLVANDRSIYAPAGLMTITGGGAYRADPASNGDGCDSTVDVCARLVVGGIEVRSGSVVPGQFILDGAMSVLSYGDIVLDGSDAVSLCGGNDGSAIAGGRAPPTIRVRGFSEWSTFATDSTTVAAFGPDRGSLVLRGVVDFLNASQVNIVLSGDLDNGSVAPECFNSVRGGFTFDGQTPQMIEVAGRDVGPALAGFNTGGDTNFSVQRLEVSVMSDVTFVNLHRNTVADGPCDEAIYIRELSIRPNAAITLDNVRVYYQTLDMADTATVATIGCGKLEQISCEQTQELTTDNLNMHRYFSFTAPNQDQETAIRVTLVDVAGFESFNGQVRWLGSPSEYPDEDSGDPGRMFIASRLQCEPHFTYWGPLRTIHVYGAAVVPGSLFALQSVHGSCVELLHTEAIYSESIMTTTAKWGDIVEPFDDPDGPTQPDFLDISSIVSKFQAIPGAPSKARTQLQPNVLNPLQPISFMDIAAGVDAFSGSAYPYAGPTDCP